MVNLLMQTEHVSLIERKLKTQTRRLVKYDNGGILACQYKVNWKYWICPAAKWKLGDNFYQDIEQIPNHKELVRKGELRRCRNAPGVFKVRTIPNNDKHNDFRLEHLLQISPEDAVREGYQSIFSFLKKFYEIYAKQGKKEAAKSLALIQEADAPFNTWLTQNKGRLWNPVVRVIDFKFLPNTERE